MTAVYLGAQCEITGGELLRARTALEEEPSGLDVHHLCLICIGMVLEQVLRGGDVHMKWTTAWEALYVWSCSRIGRVITIIYIVYYLHTFSRSA